MRSPAVALLAALAAVPHAPAAEPACPAPLEVVEGTPRAFELGTRGTVPWVEGTIAAGASALSIEATVHDTHFRAGERAWRAGDGFTINVVVPGAGACEGEDFVGLGFALEKNGPAGVLINDAGRWRLAPVAALTPRIAIDDAAHVARYTITVPWTAIPRVRPFHDGRFGLNLVYISRDDAGQRTILRWTDDDGYDTEQTNVRRFVPIAVRPTTAHLEGALSSRLVAGDAVDLALTLRAPEPIVGELVIEAGAARARIPVHAGAGTHRVTHALAVADLAPGRAIPVTARLGALSFVDTLLVWDRAAIARTGASVTALAARDGARPRAAALGLRDALERLEAERTRILPRDDPKPFAERLDRLARTVAAVAADPEHVLLAPGFASAALTSAKDGSVQPYSLWLPPGIDATTPRDLVIALHGSGVDEVRFLERLGPQLERAGVVVAAPRGRNPSDWYVGPTEDDVLQLVADVRRMYAVRKVVLYGFSMGGYGAWRYALRHPDVFAGAVVASGAPYPIWNPVPEDDLRAIDPACSSSRFLVFHGIDDHAVPIDPTDAFVARLRQRGCEVAYTRLPGKGHGDYEVAGPAIEWLAGLASAPRR